MTLKYESEILFDLMKRDGDDAPSDVLPYESELKEKYLNQVVGAYPKLQDYRPEWLNYNLYAHLPADFPVETLSNVTNATVDNVVPYAYGSAILKGQTLVNLFDRNSVTTDALDYTFDNGVYTINTKKDWCKLIFTPNLVQNKKYLIMLSTSITDVLIFYRDSSNTATRICNAGDCPFIFTNPIDNITSVSIEFPSIVTNGTLSHPMFIEYQEGMENWGISYFEGMKSVQMPGLTTTGKNLFDGELELGDIGSNDGIQTQGDFAISKNFNAINGGVNVICIIESSMQGRIYYYDGNKNFISTTIIANLEKTPQNAKYFKLRFNKDYLNSNIMVVYGTSITSYEPYQSNILTVNEEVELRGIGDVRDELNLLTGELTQRIGVYTITGKEPNLVLNTKVTYPIIEMALKEIKSDSRIMSNKIAEANAPLYSSNTVLGIDVVDKTIRIRTKEILDGQSLNEFKETMLPLTIKYELAQESVKTLELTVTDHDGNTESTIRPIEGKMHVSTSSQTLPPLLDMSVPVEATTQNLMSFANIEEEE